jgi:hypothetical protein
MLLSIPSEIFSCHIAPYLSDTDLKRLSQTCKSFKSFRPESYLYYLNVRYSRKFVTSEETFKKRKHLALTDWNSHEYYEDGAEFYKEFPSSECFRNKVVKTFKKNISLNLTPGCFKSDNMYNSYSTIDDDVNRINFSVFDMNYDMKFETFEHVVKLNLSKLSIKVDLSILRNVSYLDLSYSDSFDVSTLSHLHYLNLSHTKVTDVSALGNVHTLNLSNTPVTDVSALGNVHKLNLSRTKVTDVSALGNVHTLNLSWTDVTDVSALGNVHTLNLSYTRVTDVSALGNVDTLSLDKCYGVYDISMLNKVRFLNLKNTVVKKIPVLEQVEELDISNSINFKDFSSLVNFKNLKALNIYCTNIVVEPKRISSWFSSPNSDSESDLESKLELTINNPELLSFLLNVKTLVWNWETSSRFCDKFKLHDMYDSLHGSDLDFKNF